MPRWGEMYAEATGHRQDTEWPPKIAGDRNEVK
jgi:hypothetical protein